jgi:RimJ/RimL family protein N-acetyltransferase
MQLTCLTKENCEQVRQWRNLNLAIWRTPYLITKEMQEDFYNNIVCDRKSEHRYWAVWEEFPTVKTLPSGLEIIVNENIFIGQVGLCSISLENRNAEISMVINPDLRGQGLGVQALELLFEKGFNEINLENIYAECYICNPDYKFWESMTEKYYTRNAILADRKYWNGILWDSLYINFNKNTYRKEIV